MQIADREKHVCLRRRAIFWRDFFPAKTNKIIQVLHGVSRDYRNAKISNFLTYLSIISPMFIFTYRDINEFI